MGSKVQIPGSQFLLSWFLSFIMGLIVNKEKVVPDLHYDNLPNIGIYIYVYILIVMRVCSFFLQLLIPGKYFFRITLYKGLL